MGSGKKLNSPKNSRGFELQNSMYRRIFQSKFQKPRLSEDFSKPEPEKTQIKWRIFCQNVNKKSKLMILIEKPGNFLGNPQKCYKTQTISKKTQGFSKKTRDFSKKLKQNSKKLSVSEDQSSSTLQKIVKKKAWTRCNF